jgi:tetratricopeptide (TPR) repeat protein
MYTYTMMPNKTIYVKDADLPLLEQAQEQLGESVSSMFAEFLRERVARLTPEESRIIDLINQIARKREAVTKERGLPDFLQGEYDEAEAYAEKALKSLRAGEIRNAKALYWAANAYYERAERDVKDSRDLGGKIAEVLGKGRPSASKKIQKHR